METVAIDSGKPRQNKLNESFNGKFRDECLAMEWFKNRPDAKILIEAFRRTEPFSREHWPEECRQVTLVTPDRQQAKERDGMGVNSCVCATIRTL